MRFGVEFEIDLNEECMWVSRNGHHYPFAFDANKPLPIPHRAALISDEEFAEQAYMEWDEGYAIFKEKQNGS